MTLLSVNHRILTEAQAARKKPHKLGRGWEPAGGTRFYRYQANGDYWELVTPKAKYRQTAGGYEKIPVEEREYEPCGIEFYPYETVWKEPFNNNGFGLFNFLRVHKKTAIVEGKIFDIRMSKDSQWYWWWQPPDAVVAGRGDLTIEHTLKGNMGRISFANKARSRKVNKEVWLEQRRMRAKNEKSLKVIQKLGSVCPDSLPQGWRFDEAKAVDAYHNLLASLDPDCPSVSEPDMKYFGECVLWHANRYNWRGSALTQEQVDRAFVAMRNKLRTAGYAKNEVYEYEDYKDFPHSVKV